MTPVEIGFGDCALSTERIELRRGGQIVDMEPQVFDVLAYLIRHRERVVPKTELLDQIWGNRFVSESALVLRAIDGIRAGTGAAIQVSGSPGSGKTQLLHQVAETARRQALAVGTSAPVPGGRGPYACIAGALSEMAQQHPGLLGAIPAGCRAELERAFAGQPPTTRQRWFMAVREFLVTAAEQSGAVLLIDDLDLASPEALTIINDAARLTRDHPLAVVIAQRSGGRGQPPFEVVELADRDRPPADRHAPLDLPAELAEVLRRVAQIGDRFDRSGSPRPQRAARKPLTSSCARPLIAG
jgi:hypothetical protein